MKCTHHDIVALMQGFAVNTGRAVSTVSRLASGSGATFNRLQRGHDLTTRRAARVTQYFSDNWPSGLAWPDDIPRPAPAPGSPAGLAAAPAAPQTGDAA